MPYRDGLALQEEAVAKRRAGATGDRLLLLEHPPVITLGRNAREENLLLGPAERQAQGLETIAVARGGDVTYHAPGQLVGYLVVDLAAGGKPDVSLFLRGIESALIGALAALRVPARRVPGRTGVFAGARPEASPDRKIASIGIGLRGWVSWHGFALNVDNDVAAFDCIVPCGLQDIEMTSVARELSAGGPGRLASPLGSRARRAVAQAFSSWFAPAAVL